MFIKDKCMRYEEYFSKYHIAIKEKVEEGNSNVDIARYFGLDQHLVGRIVKDLGFSKRTSFANNKDSEEYKQQFIDDCIRVYKEHGNISHSIYKQYGRFYYKDINRLFGTIANLISSVPELRRAKFSRKSLENFFFERLERDFGLKPLYRRYKGFKWLKSDKGFLEIDAVYNKPCLFGIEFDDQSHFNIFRGDDSEEKFKRRKYLDDLKDRLCKENGFTLIRFAYNEDLSEEAILKKLSLINVQLCNSYEGRTTYSLDTPVEAFVGLELTKYNKYSSRVYLQKTLGGVKHRSSKRLGSYYIPLLAAISREKFLLDNPEYNSVRNDISSETLKNLGFSSWDAVSSEGLDELDSRQGVIS